MDAWRGVTVLVPVAKEGSLDASLDASRNEVQVVESRRGLTYLSFLFRFVCRFLSPQTSLSLWTATGLAVSC